MSDAPQKLVIEGEVTVRAVASKEDPYGTGGFSTLAVHVLASDAASTAELRKHFLAKAPITVRCGALEVDGQIEKCDPKMPGVASMAVTNIRMANPR